MSLTDVNNEEYWNEYFLKLSEEEFQNVDIEGQCFLMALGMEVRHKMKNDKDEHLQSLNKKIAKAYDERDQYTFNKKNNIKQ